jgi:hypothetical protein
MTCKTVGVQMTKNTPASHLSAHHLDQSFGAPISHCGGTQNPSQLYQFKTKVNKNEITYLIKSVQPLLLFFVVYLQLCASVLVSLRLS